MTPPSQSALIRPERPTVATHWGLYRAQMRGDEAIALVPHERDSDPADMGPAMLQARTAATRVLFPCVRRSFLETGRHKGQGRGREPFVRVSWDTALDLAAGQIARVKRERGNEGIFGGSYGWSSAGRFHHAQSHVHRFLNAAGGFVRSVGNYSYAAGDVILPYIWGSTRGLVAGHTPWSLIANHTELIVMFGGAPTRNTQVNAGGIARHDFREGIARCRAGGTQFVNVSPIRDDAPAESQADWLAIRPTTDTAMMLGLAHTLITEELVDHAFLDTCTVGYDEVRRYVLGDVDGQPKDATWAASICGLSADTIVALARRMAGSRTLLMVTWALQRAEHGEQPYWMAAALAAMLGGIGLPGGGIGYGYGSAGGIGKPNALYPWPSLPQGSNAVAAFIPVARITDMLLSPGQPFDFNGATYSYPSIDLVYWAGGNPFHHHQDLNRLVAAWQRPGCVIVNEQFWTATARHADIVLPAALPIERNDIAASNRDTFIAASHKICAPAGEARTDFEIFTGLARRLGCETAYTGGRDEAGWLTHLYADMSERMAKRGHPLPPFESFWSDGLIELPPAAPDEPLHGKFRADPAKHPLATPSGRIELASPRIAGFAFANMPGHPAWLEPTEWLGSKLAQAFPLHLLSNQPANKLHSQYDQGERSRRDKPHGRERLRMHPEDAAARDLADGQVVRVFNGRGSVIAVVKCDDGIARHVVQMATGAWFDPDLGANAPLERHGNPNALTPDIGTSPLGQGPSSNTCLVEVEAWIGPLPPVQSFTPPEILEPLEAAPR